MRNRGDPVRGKSKPWSLFDRFEIPDYDGDGIYLTRWRIIQTPYASLFLHRMTGPDPRPTLHDHPWRFLSIVLRGGYVERRLDPRTMEVNEEHRVRWVNRMPLESAHAIRQLLRTPTWTFLFVGRRVRTWGYLEQGWFQGPDAGPTPGAWIWTEFDKHRHTREFDAAMAKRRRP